MAEQSSTSPMPENIENIASSWDFSEFELFFIDLYFARALEEQFMDPIFKDEFDVKIDAVFQALPPHVQANIEAGTETPFAEQKVEEQIRILEKALSSEAKWAFLHETAQKEALIIAELLQNYLRSKGQDIRDMYQMQDSERENILRNVYAAYHRQLEQDIKDFAKLNRNLLHKTPNDVHHLPEASAILDQTANNLGIDFTEKRKKAIAKLAAEDRTPMGSLAVPTEAVLSSQIDRSTLFSQGLPLKARENLKVQVPKIKQRVEVKPMTGAENSLKLRIQQEEQRLSEESAKQDTSQQEQVDQYRKYIEARQKAEQEQSEQQARRRKRRKVTQSIVRKVATGNNPALLAAGATGAGVVGMGGGIIGYYIYHVYYQAPEITFLSSLFF